MAPFIKNTMIPVASTAAIQFAKEHGEDVSFTDNDRHIEAYKWRNQIYIANVQKIPARE